MNITAKKVVEVYAEVTYNERQYRVSPTGYVEVWDSFDGRWDDDVRHNRQEIMEAGLEVLK